MYLVISYNNRENDTLNEKIKNLRNDVVVCNERRYMRYHLEEPEALGDIKHLGKAEKHDCQKVEPTVVETKPREYKKSPVKKAINVIRGLSPKKEEKPTTTGITAVKQRRTIEPVIKSKVKPIVVETTNNESSSNTNYTSEEEQNSGEEEQIPASQQGKINEAKRNQNIKTIERRLDELIKKLSSDKELTKNDISNSNRIINLANEKAKGKNRNRYKTTISQYLEKKNKKPRDIINALIASRNIFEKYGYPENIQAPVQQIPASQQGRINVAQRKNENVQQIPASGEDPVEQLQRRMEEIGSAKTTHRNKTANIRKRRAELEEREKIRKQEVKSRTTKRR